MGDCIDALKNQDCDFKIEYISSVSPMSTAFQAMPDNCKTPYFIQVDADMILYSDAVRRLYESVKKSHFWVYRVAGQLYEEGFGIGGAVKCWKLSIFRFFSFNDCRTVDRDFHGRVRRFGLRIKKINDVIGIHRPRHSDFSYYLKTKSDIEKWRFLKRSPELYALPLFDEVISDTNISSYRLFGMLFGSLTQWDRLKKSKDAVLEKKRFNMIISLFDKDELFINFEIDEIDARELRLAFVKSYNDFFGRNLENRTVLLKIIIQLLDTRRCDSLSIESELMKVIEL